MRHFMLFPLFIAALTITGCAEKDNESASDTAAVVGEDVTTIPDPGDEYAPDRWYDDGGYHGTPETAQPMGIALMSPTYINGGVDPETGNIFYVFRTAPDQTSFEVNLRDKTTEIDWVHIHEGTDLIFGDEVTPIEVISPRHAEWELEGDTIYVLEVHSITGGYF